VQLSKLLFLARQPQGASHLALDRSANPAAENGGGQMTRKPSEVAPAFATRRLAFDLDLMPLRFEALPLSKVVNWFLTESSVYFKPSRPWGLPTILQVEPTSRCNLQCRICPVGTGLERPAGDMDLALFQRIVDELRDSLLVMMFWDWGEPFLNPRAYDMIRYARRAGVKVVSSTNGHVFAAGEQAREAVESGLDVLVFSVDGISQETYQHFRRKGRLDTVLEGIRRVVAEKRRSGSRTPIVNLRFIVMQHGEHEVPLLREFAQGLGVDVLTLRKFHFVPGTTEGRGPEAEARDRAGGGLVPRQSRFQLPLLAQDTKTPARAARNPCRNLWNCPTVHWDGTVCSCFMDFNERRPLGSLRQDSFKAIWRGDRYRNLRREFRRRWQQLPLCGECASGFEGGDVGREANAEAVFFTEGG
jgi:MoaA/NifB/PqqE/SkfB family radical SAM enzyme